MASENRLTPLPSIDERVAGSKSGGTPAISSEVPDMPAKLSAKEKKIWTHVTQALHEYGLIHRTDGLLLTVICRTFTEWVDATEQLEKVKRDNNGSYITESANGYRSAHPLYYIARDLKKSLLSWLPEAALTIPSFQKAAGEALENPQGSLFDDPIERFRQQKTVAGMRVVKK